MNEDVEQLPPAEKARVNARDRKVRGPKVIVDNPGLRKIALDAARKQREANQRPKP